MSIKKVIVYFRAQAFWLVIDQIWSYDNIACRIQEAVWVIIETSPSVAIIVHITTVKVNSFHFLTEAW